MKYFYRCFFIIILLANTALAETNKLKVAVFLEPPFVDLVANKLVGESIDIAHLLAESIGLTPVFIQCPPMRCLTMVKLGQADMMVGLSKSLTREKYFIYLTPPYLLQHQPLRFFTLKQDNLTIKTLSDLDPLLVGTLRGAIYFPLFDQNKTIKKVELTSRKQMVNMLLKGRIDTFLEREESVLPLLSTSEYQNKFTIADYGYNQPINSYIVISKRSRVKGYANELSQALAKALSDGTINNFRLENRAK